MTEGPELSASESLAWQAAYDSNEAYDQLQAAISTREQYDNLGAISLKGVTVSIDKDVMAAVDKEIETAQNDFDLLRGMADAVAMRENSPFTPTSAKGSVSAGKENGKESENGSSFTGESPVSASMQDAVIWLLEHGGRDDAGPGNPSAGSKIRSDIGVSGRQWERIRSNLEEEGIVVFEKTTPEARRFKSVYVNEAHLALLERDKKLPEHVKKALNDRNEQLAEEREKAESDSSGDEPDFLGDKGGQEPAGHEEPAEPEKSKPESAPRRRRRRAQQGPAAKPNKPKKTADPDGKIFTLKVSAEGATFSRSISVKQLKGLPLETRVLLGIGQVNSPTHSFLTDEKQKRDFALRIINKGITDEEGLTDETMLEELVQQAIEKGHLHQNGNGPDLTGAGVQFIGETKMGRHTLGQQTIGTWRKPEAGADEEEHTGLRKRGGSRLDTAKQVA